MKSPIGIHYPAVDRGSLYTAHVLGVLVAIIGAVAIAYLGTAYGLLSWALLLLMVALGSTLFVAGMSRRIEWAAYAILFTSPLVVYRQEFLGINVTLQRIFLGLGILALLANAKVRRRGTSFQMPVALRILAVFMLLKGVDLIRTAKPELVIRQLGILGIGWAIMAFLVATLDSEVKLKRAVGVFLLGSLIPVGIGVYQLITFLGGGVPELPLARYFSPRDSSPDPRMLRGDYWAFGDWGYFIRASGTLGPPMHGEYLVMLLLILSAVLMARVLGGRRRAAGYAYTIILAIQLVTTFSRSAWIVALVGISALIVAQPGRGKLGRALLIGITVGGFVSLLLTAFIPGGAIRETLLSLLSLENPTTMGARYESLAVHYLLRKRALDLFMEHSLWGVGLGNYGALTGQGQLLSSAHATFVTEAAEGGIIGMTILAAFVMSILLPLWQQIKSTSDDAVLKAFRIGLFSAIVAHAFNNTVLYNTFYFDHSWALLGLGLAFASLSQPTVTDQASSSPNHRTVANCGTSTVLDCQNYARGGEK